MRTSGSTFRPSTARRRAVVLATSAAIIGGVAGASPAQAAPVDTTPSYACVSAKFGATEAFMYVDLDIPATVQVGEPLRFGLRATVLGRSLTGPGEAGSGGITGSADLDVGISATDQTTSVRVVAPAATTEPYDARGNFALDLNGGTVSAAAIEKPGPVTLSLASFKLTLDVVSVPGAGDGDAEGPFEVTCEIKPGRSTTLATIDAVAATPSPTPTPPLPDLPNTFDLTGSATLKGKAPGTLPLKGTLDSTINVWSGQLRGTLSKLKGRARLTAYGFLPLTADIEFDPVQGVTGDSKIGNFGFSTRVRTLLPSIKLLGLPVGGGADCQSWTDSPLSLSAVTKPFDPSVGGAVKGTFDIGGLTGCGSLTSTLFPLISSTGNTITLNLVRRKATA